MITGFNQELPVKDSVVVTAEQLEIIKNLYKQDPSLVREFAIAALEYSFTGDVITDNNYLKSLIHRSCN